MRSSFIIASLALSVLAVPVPEEHASALNARGLTRNGNGEWTVTNNNLLARNAGLEKRGKSRYPGRSVDVEIESTSDNLEKRGKARYPGRSVDVKAEPEKEVDLEKRGKARYPGRSVDVEAEPKKEVDLEKRGKARYPGRSVDVEIESTSDNLEKRGKARYPGRSVKVEVEEEETEEVSSQAKIVARSNIFGANGIIEALKARGWSSANSLPVRETV